MTIWQLHLKLTVEQLCFCQNVEKGLRGKAFPGVFLLIGLKARNCQKDQGFIEHLAILRNEE